MKAKIEIQMDNAALADCPATELARILAELAEDLRHGGVGRTSLRDINGNRVGFFEITP